MKTEILSGCSGSGAVTIRWQTGWVSKEQTINGVHYDAILEYATRIYFFDCPDCKADEIADCANCTNRQKRFEKFEQMRDYHIAKTKDALFDLREAIRDKKIPAKPPKGTLDVWTSLIDRLYVSKESQEWREAIRNIWNPPLMFPQEAEQEKGAL